MNSSNNLPQYQRGGAMQGAADAEWQRALLERLRQVCREEMTEVMKGLVEEGHITPALEEKLTDVEVTAKSLQEDVRQSANMSRGAVWKSVLTATARCLLLCGGGLAALHFLGGFNLISASEVNAQKVQVQQKAQLMAEVQQLNEAKVALDNELKAKTAQQQVLTVELNKSAEAQRALAANMKSLEQQLKRLQQLQEQFRFKLVRGEQGGAYVEVPTNSKPFSYGGKEYIQVK